MPAGRRLVVRALLLILWTVWLVAPGAAQSADTRTRLADAAERRDRATVRRLVSRPRVDVNAAGRDGTPALHWAVRFNDLETAALLIRAGADVRKPNRYGLMPVSLAAQNANPAMIKLLVESGADVNATDAAGETPLVAATAIGGLSAVEALVEAGATVDARDRVFQQSALMVAVRFNHPDLVRYFLAHGAQVNARTRVGETPKWVLPNSVPGFGHGIGIVRGGLPPRGSRPLVPGAMSPLLYAARDGRRESMRLLLDAGADIDQTDANGITPLLMAISNNHPETALLLVERGADVRAMDWYGRTALWAAVEARNMDVDNATFVNSVDRGPFLPLIRELLRAGSDVNARLIETPPIRRHMLPITGSLAWVDFTGQTPFLAAALAADLDVMRMLLEAGADPRIPTFEGTTALMAAAGVNWVMAQTYDEGPAARLAAVRLCVDMGLDVNAVNAMGLTAIHGAANRGSDDIIGFLAQKGARLDVKDKEGRTPLNWAEGVFLATHPAVAKPSSITLITSLLASTPPGTVSPGARSAPESRP
jgi:ankyrin repeat protein